MAMVGDVITEGSSNFSDRENHFLVKWWPHDMMWGTLSCYFSLTTIGKAKEDYG